MSVLTPNHVAAGPRSTRWTLGHRPALDGIRGLAIMFVLSCHLALPGMTGAGAVGVAVFFTLSGFLITSLLLEERERTGRISLARFYVRRARRLVPALVVSTVAVSTAALALDRWWLEGGDVAPALLYYSNWVEADPADSLHALGGTWSLAVEEQFYLLWPLVLLTVAPRGRRWVMAVAASGIAFSLASRAYLLTSGAPSDRVYYGSDTVACALLGGALLATYLGCRPEGRTRPAVAVLATGALLGLSTWGTLTAALHALPWVALATTLLLWSACGSSGLPLVERRILIWFGQRSYGIYLWHCPFAWALRDQLRWEWPMILAVAGVSSLVLAELSYRFVEAPWRRSPAHRAGSWDLANAYRN